jgi:flagellar motor switch protein FliN/FliY
VTADEVTSTDATSIPHAAVVAAANALGAALGLGAAADTTQPWPTGSDTTVLVAGISGGGLDGGLLLAVDGGTAARIADDPTAMAAAFRASLDALVTATGLVLELGEFGTTDAVPTTTTELRTGDATAAHFGLVLDAGDANDEQAAPAPDHAAGPVATDFQPAPLGPRGAVATPSTSPLTLLHDVEMSVTVELGRTTMPIRDLLSLQPGMVVEIDRAAGSPIDVLVNGRLIACGEVVVIDEEFGIRITEIIPNGKPM